MGNRNYRLYFIDAIRAWAILMMLQGHFIDGLLDDVFRNDNNLIYSIWKYFRGITAPVFFTVSGFIFTYLLIKVPLKGFENPRIKKGLKRGIELLIIGYLLRINFLGLLKAELYSSFYLVDVLHCIGLSIIIIIGIYLLVQNGKKYLFPLLLLTITGLLFIFEPHYKEWNFEGLPVGLANYFTKENGSVFTIIPWLGYTTFGAFLSVLFTRFKTHKFLYEYAILLCLITGITLIFLSSDFFLILNDISGRTLFKAIASNNYLIIRLGDVFIVFALFMVFRKALNNVTFLKIGQSTLSIYVIHFIILYGSFTGLGLYRFFNHELNPIFTILGAIVFMITCSFLALQYEKNKLKIKSSISLLIRFALSYLARVYIIAFKYVRVNLLKFSQLFKFLKS